MWNTQGIVNQRTIIAAVSALATCAVADIGPGECDGERPQFEADEYQAFGGGQIAVGTQWRFNNIGGVLNVYDLTSQTTAPLGVNWPTNVYTHPDWVRSRMGQLFGVALDDVGNIYAAHSAIYVQDSIGSIGGQPGQVYKVDAVTGVPTVFAKLPNNSDPAIAAAHGIGESYPGLGNLCFDVGKQMVYVSNFEDGRIYRIDSTGTCLSTWEHSSGLVADCTPENDDIDGDGIGDGVARLGERVWAVQSFNGRVYYSLWVEDQGAPSPGSNEIWSVAYDAVGDFIAGTEQLEITMPVLVNGYSNPVADISFGPTGQMMCAERTMETNLASGRFDTAPHKSRAFEYICANGTDWFLSPNAFQIGAIAGGNNSAGGCDYSYAASPDDRVWVTGDAIFFSNPGTGPNVYGIQGLPQSGGGVSNSILIDMDANIDDQDKRQIGSVEVSCPGPIVDPCATISNEEILCALDDSGNYTYSVDLTNNSGQDVAHIIVLPSTGGVDVVPSGLITLPTLLLDGDTTQVSITFNGGLAGEELCFILSLHTIDFEECCAIEPCIIVPECDCAQIHDEIVECLGFGTDCFTYTYDVDNLTGIDIYHSFFVPISPAGITIDSGNVDPSGWNYPPMVDNGTETINLTICGAMPGEEVCFLMTMHNEGLDECCSIEVCVTAPVCTLICTGDCNGDGILDFFDIACFIDYYNNQLPGADFNGDGIFNFFDVSTFLAAFGEGCP